MKVIRECSYGQVANGEFFSTTATPDVVFFKTENGAAKLGSGEVINWGFDSPVTVLAVTVKVQK